MLHQDETRCQDDSCVLDNVHYSAMPCFVFQAVLAVIIMVNLQAILAQFRDVCVLWRSDKLDLVSMHACTLTHTHTELW